MTPVCGRSDKPSSPTQEHLNAVEIYNKKLKMIYKKLLNYLMRFTFQRLNVFFSENFHSSQYKIPFVETRQMNKRVISCRCN